MKIRKVSKNYYIVEERPIKNIEAFMSLAENRELIYINGYCKPAAFFINWQFRIVASAINNGLMFKAHRFTNAK